MSTKLISVTKASKISGLTGRMIRKLLHDGQIEGVKIGWSWLTTEEAIIEYVKQERRPGPKPRRENRPKRRKT